MSTNRPERTSCWPEWAAFKVITNFAFGLRRRMRIKSLSGPFEGFWKRLIFRVKKRNINPGTRGYSNETNFFKTDECECNQHASALGWDHVDCSNRGWCRRGIDSGG